MTKKSSSRKSARSLHVLFTGLFTPNVLSGGDQLIFDILPRLPKDLAITVVMPHFAKKHWDKLAPMKNVTFKLLPPNRFEFRTNPIMIFLAYTVRAWQTYRLLRKEDVHTLYSCSDIAYADIWPAYWLARRRADIKWLSRVYHVLLPPGKRQGSKFGNTAAFYLQRLSFMMMRKRSTTIFALNGKLYNELLTLGFPQNKLRVLGAGIDYTQIKNTPPTRRYDYDVVAMGRVAPVKGIFDAIKAWKTVHDKAPNLQLGWIGSLEGGYDKQVSDAIQSSGLKDSFHLLGFMDKNDAYSVLKSASIFLCPDHENGWGLAVCEAMSCGLPVVSYDLDIFGSVYQKGYLTAPLFDTSSLAAKILALVQDDKKRQALAKDAASQAREFDHDKVLTQLLLYI